MNNSTFKPRLTARGFVISALLIFTLAGCGERTAEARTAETVSDTAPVTVESEPAATDAEISGAAPAGGESETAVTNGNGRDIPSALEKRETEPALQSIGRVVIPSAGIDIPLIVTSENESAAYLQSVVDAGNAVQTPNCGCTVIAAHTNRGFNAIKQAVPGKTAAYVNGVAYICAGKFNGYNRRAYLTDAAGNKLENIPGLVMYTCNDCWQNVTVTVWKEV